MIYPINLQLFADGGAGAGAAGAGSAGTTGATPQAAAADTGVNQQAAAAGRSRMGRRNAMANVNYGVPPQQAAGAAQQATPEQKTKGADANGQKPQGGDYKYNDEDVQRILKGRLKGAEENQQRLDKLTPMLAEMAKRMGKDPTDIDGIVAKYMDDDSLYEEESVRTGTPIPVLKQLHRMEKERDAAQQQVSQFTEEAQNRRHLMNLIQQGEALKVKYPQFDLQKEMQNDRFVAMTAPNGGLSVEEAYYALHHQELASGAMQYAARQAQQQVAQTIQANMARPTENGVSSAAPAAEWRSDPRQLSRKDLKEISRRVHAGDTSISF